MRVICDRAGGCMCVCGALGHTFARSEENFNNWIAGNRIFRVARVCYIFIYAEWFSILSRLYTNEIKRL